MKNSGLSREFAIEFSKRSPKFDEATEMYGINTPEDFDNFLDIFLMCRKTHYVYKSHNENLKDLTKKTLILTRDRYKHLGYNLYKNGRPENMLKTPELQVPSYFTDWERGYQQNGFRATIVENPVSTLGDFL